MMRRAIDLGRIFALAIALFAASCAYASDDMSFEDGRLVISSNAGADEWLKIKIDGPNSKAVKSELREVELIGSVTLAGSGYVDIFSNCPFLDRVEIRCDLARVPKNAFFRCTSLKSIVIPSTARSIAEKAFAESGIESIVIGYEKGVDIYKGAFMDCASLRRVEMAGKIGKLGKDAFNGVPEGLEIIAPTSTFVINTGSTVQEESKAAFTAKADIYVNEGMKDNEFNASCNYFDRDLVTIHRTLHSKIADVIERDSSHHWYACSTCDERLDVEPHLYDRPLADGTRECECGQLEPYVVPPHLPGGGSSAGGSGEDADADEGGDDGTDADAPSDAPSDDVAGDVPGGGGQDETASDDPVMPSDVSAGCDALASFASAVLALAAAIRRPR